MHLGEMIERDLMRLSDPLDPLCMEVGTRLGKHWGKALHEDLSELEISLI